MRRDLQQTFTALTDAAILIAGRVVETAGWMRKLDVVTTNGQHSSEYFETRADQFFCRRNGQHFGEEWRR